jgi:hypothetical protein
VWTGFIWLRQGSVTGSCDNGNVPVGSISEAGNLLTSCVTVSFLKALLPGVSSRHETRNSQKFSCSKSEILGAP